MKKRKHKRGFYKYKKMRNKALMGIVWHIPGLENNWFKRHGMGLNRYRTMRTYWERNFDKIMKGRGCRW